MKDINIKGARQHNLKNVSVTIPATNPRRSAEPRTAPGNQRSHSIPFTRKADAGTPESLSSYARQFLRP
ncbi:MAG: hypothetical protein WC598_02450 [Methanoregula sp.]